MVGTSLDGDHATPQMSIRALTEAATRQPLLDKSSVVQDLNTSDLMGSEQV